MPEVTASGLNIHYRDVGDGFPIVFLHGHTGNTRNWALTVPSLRDRFRCVSIDHPGHGQSESPADTAFYALSNMAAVAYAAIREIGIEECYLVGHSMGGMISQHVVLDHPELARALVLVGTAAAPITGFASWNEKLRQTARAEGIEAAFDLLSKQEPRAAIPDFLRLWREQFLMTSVDAYIGGSLAMRDREPLLDRFASLTVPALIVCGENDERFLQPSREMHGAIRGSELVIISGAGHSPTFEASAEFNRTLSGFLDRVHAATPA